jgi:phosphoribosylaminoimidazole-succinocarboxamide synthase
VPDGAAQLRAPVVELPLVASGKVRELYDAGDDRLLLVASDRISAFDVVLPTPIPDKGRVLTGLSRFWFAATARLVPNHLLSAALDDFPDVARTSVLAGRTLLVRRLDMLPLECVVRGYLAGSGWRDYREQGAICGVPLPRGLREGERLPEPIFTPATKAASGHDENIGLDEARDLVGAERLAQVERLSLAVYRLAERHAAARSILLADTKLEFGVAPDGGLVLADEVLTPDSSRFWPAEGWRPGSSPPSFDKQYVRNWLEAQPWDKTAPGPALPDAVVAGTSERYRQAYELLVGRPFSDYLEGSDPCA